jgi:hypothetical protein
LLNAVLFSLDPGLAALVRSIADQSIEFTLERLVDSQPTGFEISRTLGTSNPDAVLLEVADPERDIVYARAIHMAAPQLPIVAVTDRDISKELELSPDCGITEVLPWPFTVIDFEDALQRAVRGAGDSHHENLIAFLPAKAGSGTSTTVMNTAGMLAGQLKKGRPALGPVRDYPRCETAAFDSGRASRCENPRADGLGSLPGPGSRR